MLRKHTITERKKNKVESISGRGKGRCQVSRVENPWQIQDTFKNYTLMCYIWGNDATPYQACCYTIGTQG